MSRSRDSIPELVLPYKVRWRAFTYSDISIEPKHSNEWLFSGGVPELVHLSLCLRDEMSVVPFNRILLKLRTLCTNHFLPFDEDLKGQLEELELTAEFLSPEAFMAWLPRRNNLRSLKAHYGCVPGSIGPEHILYFGKLENLDLQGSMAEDFMPIVLLMPSRPTFKLELWTTHSPESLENTVFQPPTIPSIPHAPLLISFCTRPVHKSKPVSAGLYTTSRLGDQNQPRLAGTLVGHHQGTEN